MEGLGNLSLSRSKFVLRTDGSTKGSVQELSRIKFAVGVGFGMLYHRAAFALGEHLEKSVERCRR